MFRNLEAIEIAEGALLADIAIICQLLTIYLPVGDGIFRMLIFIVFAVLVLRRELYVGAMGLCVAVFVVGVVTGPSYLPGMFLQCVGGLFLGYTMKRRTNHFLLLLVGVTCGALSLYIVIILTSLIFGIPLTTYVHSLQVSYNAFTGLIDLIAANLGISAWWRGSISPTLSSLANLAFAYWWIAYYLLLWVFFWPAITLIYAITNLFVRLLGYDVRPFPSERATRWVQRRVRSVVRLALRSGLIKRHKVGAQ